ncbi:unnamed protein product [Orchesella dallaii]|uniref:Uncharacterized protein n=1 Tax=Orchesella dallaii TaxID=48710 RepID=A0ABP1S7I2_9HEXA
MKSISALIIIFVIALFLMLSWSPSYSTALSMGSQEWPTSSVPKSWDKMSGIEETGILRIKRRILRPIRIRYKSRYDDKYASHKCHTDSDCALHRYCSYGYCQDRRRKFDFHRD